MSAACAGAAKDVATGSRIRAMKPRGSLASSSSVAPLAEQQRESLAHVRKPDALSGLVPAPQPGAGVGDGQQQALRLERLRADLDAAAVGRELDAVLDRVLDERDQHARRKRRAPRASSGTRTSNSQSLAEARAS